MKIQKTIVVVDGEITLCDTIEWNNALWLVPHWLESHSRAQQRPLRIVRVDSLRLRPGPFGPADNMQWQTVHAAKLKDRQEHRLCRDLKLGRPLPIQRKALETL